MVILSIRKGDVVETKCGFVGKISKYSSNKHIEIDKKITDIPIIYSSYYVEIFTKEDIKSILVPFNEDIRFNLPTGRKVKKPGLYLSLKTGVYQIVDEKGKVMFKETFKLSTGIASFIKKNKLTIQNIKILPSALVGDLDELELATNNLT